MLVGLMLGLCRRQWIKIKEIMAPTVLAYLDRTLRLTILNGTLPETLHWTTGLQFYDPLSHVSMVSTG